MGKRSKESSENSIWDLLSRKQAARGHDNGKLDQWGSWGSALNETGDDTWKQPKGRITLDDDQNVTEREHQRKPKSPCCVSKCHPRNKSGGYQAESPASQSPPRPSSDHSQYHLGLDAREETGSIRTSWGLLSGIRHASRDGSCAGHYDWEQSSLRQTDHETRKHLKHGISPDYCLYRSSRDGVEESVAQSSCPSRFNSSSREPESWGRTTLLHSDAKRNFDQWNPPLDRPGLQARKRYRHTLSPDHGLKSIGEHCASHILKCPSKTSRQEKRAGGPYPPSSQSYGSLYGNDMDTHREGVSLESIYARMAFKDHVLGGDFCRGGASLGQSISDSQKRIRCSFSPDTGSRGAYWSERRSPSFDPSYSYGTTRGRNGPRQSAITSGKVSPVSCASSGYSKRNKDMYHECGTSVILEHRHDRESCRQGRRMECITSSLRDGGNFSGGWLCVRDNEKYQLYKDNRCTYSGYEGHCSEGLTSRFNRPVATRTHDKRRMDESFGQVVGLRCGFDGSYEDSSECFFNRLERLELARNEGSRNRLDSWRNGSNAETSKILKRKCPKWDDQTAKSDGGWVGRDEGGRSHRRRDADESVGQRVEHHGVYETSYKDPSESFCHHNEQDEQSRPEIHYDNLDARRNDKWDGDAEINEKVERNGPKWDEQTTSASNGPKQKGRKAAASCGSKWGEGSSNVHMRQSLKWTSGSDCTKSPQNTMTGEEVLRSNPEHSPFANPDDDVHQKEPDKLSHHEVFDDRSDSRRKAKWDGSADINKKVEQNGPKWDEQTTSVLNGPRPQDRNTAARNGSKRGDEKDSASKSSNWGGKTSVSWNGLKWGEGSTNEHPWQSLKWPSCIDCTRSPRNTMTGEVLRSNPEHLLSANPEKNVHQKEPDKLSRCEVFHDRSNAGRKDKRDAGAESNKKVEWNGPKWDEQTTSVSNSPRRRHRKAAACSGSKGHDEKDNASESPNWGSKTAISWNGPTWGEVGANEQPQQYLKWPSGSDCSKGPQNTITKDGLRSNLEHPPLANPDSNVHQKEQGKLSCREVCNDRPDARRKDKWDGSSDINMKVEWNGPRWDEQTTSMSTGPRQRDETAADHSGSKRDDEKECASKSPNWCGKTTVLWNRTKWGEGSGNAHLQQSFKWPIGSDCRKSPQNTMIEEVLRSNPKHQLLENPDNSVHLKEPNELSRHEVILDRLDARIKDKWDRSAEINKKVEWNGPKWNEQTTGVSSGPTRRDRKAAATSMSKKHIRKNLWNNGSKQDDEKASKSSNCGSGTTPSWNGPKWDERSNNKHQQQSVKWSRGSDCRNSPQKTKHGEVLRSNREHPALAGSGNNVHRKETKEVCEPSSDRWSSSFARPSDQTTSLQVPDSQNSSFSGKKMADLESKSSETKISQKIADASIPQNTSKSRSASFHGPVPLDTSGGRPNTANKLRTAPEEQELKQLETSQDPIKKMSGRETDECRNQAQISISEIGHPRLNTDGQSSTSIDDASLRTFKFSLAEFVKDILKPMWEEGLLSKEVHKMIAKKVVDKVTSTLGSNIPHTQVHIGEYLSFASERLARLVQEYVEIYVGKEAIQKTA